MLPNVLPHPQPLDRVLVALSRVSRYDLVLTVIPVAFLVAIIALRLTPIAAETTVTIASLVGLIEVALPIIEDATMRGQEIEVTG